MVAGKSFKADGSADTGTDAAVVGFAFAPGDEDFLNARPFGHDNRLVVEWPHAPQAPVLPIDPSDIVPDVDDNHDGQPDPASDDLTSSDHGEEPGPDAGHADEGDDDQADDGGDDASDNHMSDVGQLASSGDYRGQELAAALKDLIFGDDHPGHQGDLSGAPHDPLDDASHGPDLRGLDLAATLAHAELPDLSSLTHPHGPILG